MSTLSPQNSVAWDTNPMPGWIEGIDALQWHYYEDEQAFRKSGLCPRCRDQITIVIPFGVGPSFAPRGVLPSTVSASCNCGQEHARRPDSKVGCGQGGYVSSPNWDKTK